MPGRGLAAMIEPGHVDVVPRWRGATLHDLAVHYHTPPWAHALLGCTAQEVAVRVPMLFSLCGQAQGACARLALAEAGAAVARDAALVDTARARLAELLFEHAWRLLVDWPALAPPTDVPADEARRVLARWAQCLRPVRLGQLPAADAHAVVLQLDGLLGAQVEAAQAFIAACAPEGGDPLALGERVASRWRAWQAAAQWLDAAPERLAAFADLAGTARRAGPGTGTAELQTARGCLRHTVRLEGGRVAAYQIESPTDRTFGPAARWPQQVAGRVFAHADLGEAYVRAAVLAHDPCVAWRLVTADASGREGAG